MLLRQVLAFGPGFVVPAAASFAAIYVFTRLASPAEYGVFALVMSVAQLCQAVFFQWIQVSAVRHMEPAVRDGTVPALQAVIHRSNAITTLLFALVYAAAALLWPLTEAMRHALWIGLVIVVLRSAVAANQAFNRGALRSGRYNLIECGQSVGQLAIGTALMWTTDARALAMLAGAALASLLVLMLDLPTMAAALRRHAAGAEMRAMLRFGLPLSASFGLSYVLNAFDRLLIEHFVGTEAVGVYAVAYGLMDRTVGSLFAAISLAAYPLAVRAFEREGPAGASAQLRRNGELLLLVIVPVVALLMCLNRQIAEVMVGEAFRAAARDVMPFIALASLLAGFQLHFFDHAFFLTRRTEMFVWTIGPAALVSVAANLVLLPRIGLMGAAWSALLGYGVAVTTSALAGRRLLRVPLAAGSVLRVAAAAAGMAAAVLAFDPASSVPGLVAAFGLAAASYGACAFALDAGRLRSFLLARLRPKPRPQPPTGPDTGAPAALKVAIVGPYPMDPSVTRGGVEASVLNLARTLVSETPHEVLVIAEPEHPAAFKVQAEHRLTVVRSGRPTAFYFSSLVRVPMAMRQLLRYRPDVCHLHGSSPFVAVLSLLAPKFGIRTVFTLHGIASVEARLKTRLHDTAWNRLQGWIYAGLEAAVLRTTHSLIVDTQYVVEQMTHEGYAPYIPKVHVIPQGIETIPAEYHELPRDPLKIISIGVFSRRKGQDRLLKAFADIAKRRTDVKLVLVGAVIDERYYNEVCAAVREFGLIDRVEIVVNAPRPTVLRHLASASIFALYSSEESQGIAVCEAMSLGLPIVCTNIGGLPYVVDETYGRLSELADSHSFSRNMESVLDNAEAFRTAARNAAGNYNWRNLTQRVVSVYERRLQKP